jgi:K+-transporting ATPase ATPase C chain
MKKQIVTACLYTAITAALYGIGYPMLITGVARLVAPHRAQGSLIRNSKGEILGSELIGQPFSGPAYFHSRPSAAGTGYDATSSSGSNLASTSKALVDRVGASVTSEQASGDVPVDLVTASGSGLDPDITPAAALYQAPRIAQQRGLGLDQVHALIEQNTTQRQLGLLGEPRVNVLRLNLALDTLAPLNK